MWGPVGGGRGEWRGAVSGTAGGKVCSGAPPAQPEDQGKLVMLAEQTRRWEEAAGGVFNTHLGVSVGNIPSLPGPSNGAAGAKRMGAPGEGAKGSQEGSQQGGTRERLAERLALAAGRTRVPDLKAPWREHFLTLSLV